MPVVILPESNPAEVEVTVCLVFSVQVQLTVSPKLIVVVPWSPALRNQLMVTVAELTNANNVAKLKTNLIVLLLSAVNIFFS